MSANFTRPDYALEITPEGAIAARRQPDNGRLAAVAFVPFPDGAVQATFAPYVDKDAPRVALPGIAPETDTLARTAIEGAVRQALDSAGARSGPITLILPDTAVRVVVLDFDTFPEKEAEAIGVVRFRLRKLVPFEVDDAQVSYQILSGQPGKNGTVRAVAVTLPNMILRAYEDVVRAAGFEPGVVLSSTLAALGMVEGDAAMLVVQATPQYITTAISRGQDLLLHRTQELGTMQQAGPPQPSPEEVKEALDFLGQTIAPEIPLAHEEPFAEPVPEPFAETPPTGDPREDDLVHALSVAAAFYEDFTGHPPRPVLLAGALDAREWQRLLLRENEIALSEMVSAEDMGAAQAAGIGRAQLAAVCGALRG